MTRFFMPLAYICTDRLLFISCEMSGEVIIAFILQIFLFTVADSLHVCSLNESKDVFSFLFFQSVLE